MVFEIGDHENTWTKKLVRLIFFFFFNALVKFVRLSVLVEVSIFGGHIPDDKVPLYCVPEVT